MPTVWLTDSEQCAWRAYLESTKVLFDALDRQLQRDSDLPHAYYEILVRLSEAPDRALRMSELADLTLSSRSRLSHAVARLEERGWVQRAECPTDRRGQVASLTDAGFGVLTAAAPGHVASVRALVVNGLSAEQLAQLRTIAETIIARVSGRDTSAADDPVADAADDATSDDADAATGRPAATPATSADSSPR